MKRFLIISTILILLLATNERDGYAQQRRCSIHGNSTKLYQEVSCATGVLYIPVIFHIVYRTDEENITIEQIRSQLKVLNDDFRRKHADTIETLETFKKVAADTDIEFFLADVNGHRGVFRVEASKENISPTEIQYTALGGSDAIDPLTYLNVWVTRLDGGIFGMAKNAPEFPIAEEGVIIDYRYFGTIGTAQAPFNLGRTLTHEVGHWLGLSHLFSIDSCDDADGIPDTPVQDSPSKDCDLLQESCGSVDMVQNFMSLSEDACMNLFTQGQADVMRHTLLTRKKSLIRTSRPLATKDLSVSNNPVVYPNPSTGHFFVQGRKFQNVEVISVTDVLGREIPFNRYAKDKMIQVVVPQDIKSGIYQVECKTQDEIVKIKVVFN